MLETHSSSESTPTGNIENTTSNTSNAPSQLDVSANTALAVATAPLVVPLILSFLPAPPESTGKIRRNRCGICQKKVYVNTFHCKCDSSLVFCNTHRFPYAHNCTISTLSLHQQQIQRQNPVVRPDKFNRI